ncbi:sigma-70 family RNA polymerase sigma factor [Mariniblastus fucicola]|uniref:sigma-70 family RNA polymerase sigma factor n=1 Tax=Mariniblastus fucicola TaxID=980251 RepID=UPI001FCFCB9B|nr:sigma-70 family RNA polymerase sigma factor [Mariniblastus fucicola]
MIINQFRNYLHGLAQTESRGISESQFSASEIVQCTIIHADQSLSQCKAENAEQFKTWLRQIMVHEILNRRRRRSRAAGRKNSEVSDKQGISSSIVEPNTSPSQKIIREEERSLLMGAIQQLSEDHQSVVLARHRDKLSFGEIGSQTKRSPVDIQMIWNEAIKQLTSILKSTRDANREREA